MEEKFKEKSVVPVKLGFSIGAYKVICEIVRGNSSVVFEARPPTDFGNLAIKAIYLDRDKKITESQLSAAIDRFNSKSNLFAGLRHPNILKIFDYGFDRKSGSFYLVMEKLDGVTIKDTVTKDGRIAFEKALPIIKDIAKGLQFIHSKGLVHHGLCSSNISITANGAIIRESGIVESVEEWIVKDTSCAYKMAAYSAPERLSGLDGDYRSDIFSLGVVIYEMLSGGNPFYDSDVIWSMANIGDVKLDLLDNLHSDVSSEFANIIDDMLVKKPEKRLDNLDALINFGFKTDEQSVQALQEKEVIHYDTQDSCRICGRCNKPDLKFCESCGAPLVKIIAPQDIETVSKPKIEFRYASFSRRAVAAILDLIFFLIFAFVISQIFPSSSNHIVVVSMLIIAGWLYSSIMVSSKLKATFGKMILGIYVTDIAGKQMGFLRAAGRWLSKFLMAVLSVLLIIPIAGFFTIGFTRKRQAVHDMVANTLVLCR